MNKVEELPVTVSSFSGIFCVVVFDTAIASLNAASVADGCKSAPVTLSSDARTASAF